MPVTNYVWDPLSDNVLLETDENDVTQAVYTQEPDTFGNLISQRRDDETSWYHFDGLGSTRELTNEIESVTDTNMYDAWGVNVAATGTTENPFHWVGESGYYDDPESGDYYVRARMYNPAVARWKSEDPIWPLDSLNPFAYVSSSLPTRFDPSGFAGEKPCCGVEVGPHIDTALHRLAAEFSRLHINRRVQVCQSMIGDDGWDFFEFWQAGGGNLKDNLTGRPIPGAKYKNPFKGKNGNRCGTGSCEGTITVHGRCHWAAEANYILWGFGFRLCHEYLRSVSTFRPTGGHYMRAGDYYYDLRPGSGGGGPYYAIRSHPRISPMTLAASLKWVGLWRGVRYGIAGGRYFFDDSNAKYRRPGVGTNPRVAWTKAGWHRDYAHSAVTEIGNMCQPCDEIYAGELQARIGNGERSTPGGGHAISVSIDPVDVNKGKHKLADDFAPF